MFNSNSLFDILKGDYKWDSTVDYEYQTENSCEESGCNEEGICRCGVIVNAKVTKVDVSHLSQMIYDSYFGDTKSSNRDAKINTVLFGTGKDIDIYTIDRILRVNKIWEECNWEIDVCSGYYGQEINRVSLDREFSNKLGHDIIKALSIESLEERVKFLLMLEYGSILTELSDPFDVITYSIDTIEKSNVIFGSDGHYNKVINKNLPHYSDDSYSGIRGIVILDTKRHGKRDCKYRLIDGYHRMTSTKDKLVKVIKIEISK